MREGKNREISLFLTDQQLTLCQISLCLLSCEALQRGKMIEKEGLVREERRKKKKKKKKKTRKKKKKKKKHLIQLSLTGQFSLLLAKLCPQSLDFIFYRLNLYIQADGVVCRLSIYHFD